MIGLTMVLTPESVNPKQRRNMQKQNVKQAVTVVFTGDYHHMPDHADQPDLEGLTIRQALKALRNEDWGNLGGLTACDLSDGGKLSVGLRSCDGNSWLMSSQEACRTWPAEAWEQDPHRIYPIA